MKLKSYIWGILCSVFLASLLVACKSPASTATTNDVIIKTEEAYFASVIDRSLQFNTISARLKIDFTGNEKEFSSRAQLKMSYNNRLQLSIQPLLGIEMFRIELTNDSIKIIDRMNKRYISDSHSELKEETNINFNFQNLQALFTNQLFIPGESEISANHYRRFRMTKNDNIAKLNFNDSNGIFYTFTADAEEKLLSTNIEDMSGNNTLNWTYSNFQNINNQRFPMRMTAHLTSGDNTRGVAVFTFSTPEINTPLNMDFNIPSGYNKVKLEQIINSLTIK